MRKAGNSPSYRFELLNKASGEHESDQGIDLRSVTSIIGANLAKPALVDWAYRKTVESVEILADHVDLGEFVYADDLDGVLADNRLRPVDLRDEAADRGTDAHSYLEALAAGAAPIGTEPPNNNRFVPAVAAWWRHMHPVVEASEVLLISLRHGYAGTCDLVWKERGAGGRRVLTDLKTRDNSWTRAYESDLIQLAAYKEAWNEMFPDKKIDRTSVLIARPAGSFIEDYREVGFDTFEALLTLDRTLREFR